MQIFKEISRTDTHVTYQYQSVYGWLMYGILAGWLGAIALDLPRWIEFAFVALILAYFVGVFLPSRPRNKEIQQAMRVGMVQMSGSRWSFSNPLNIKVPLTFVTSQKRPPETSPEAK